MDALIEKLAKKFSGKPLPPWMMKKKNGEKESEPEEKNEAGEKDEKEEKGEKEEKSEKCASSLIEKLAVKFTMAKTIKNGNGATEKHIRQIAKRKIEAGECRGKPLVKK